MLSKCQAEYGVNMFLFGVVSFPSRASCRGDELVSLVV